MSFVFVGGDGAARPTYFELIAADRLVPTLKTALVYSLSVAAQRSPLAARLLEYEEEVFSLLLLLLDASSLANSNATFAESLYGLRRVATSSPGPSLTPQQRLSTLLLEVGAPFLLAKCRQHYTRLAPSPSLLGLALTRAAAHHGTHALPPGTPLPDRIRAAGSRLLLRSFPWVHAATEATRFAYQALYLALGRPYFSPSLHLLRQTVVRVSAQDLAAADKRRQEAWRDQLAWAARGGSLPSHALRRALVHAVRGVLDHGRNSIILAVFGFKVLEWWFLSAEQKLASNQALPPPPPPPPPRPADAGVGLPRNISDCPVCRRPRTNAAQAAVSGYVFCYPCLFNYVMEHSRCPVTCLPMTLDHVRKLYDDA